MITSSNGNVTSKLQYQFSLLTKANFNINAFKKTRSIIRVSVTETPFSLGDITNNFIVRKVRIVLIAMAITLQ
jgi:hypothetical protein